MQTEKFSILLADDDADDCLFFKDALDDLAIAASFYTVNNGVALMSFLDELSSDTPSMLFLDLNMPRKSGIACLSEIKQMEKLKQMAVIIYSTSFNAEVVSLLYEKGAQFYIRKPGDFMDLKSVIQQAITFTKQNEGLQPPKDKFVIQP